MSKKIPEERLGELRRQLELLPTRARERRTLILKFANLYAVSESTVYRSLKANQTPKSLRRSDAGKTRVLPQSEMENFCRIIAAMKLRTRNKKGHHLPTNEAIRLIEKYGVETSNGLMKAPMGVLKRPTVNRHLKQWGYDFLSLDIEPTVVRFQAKHSNDCWQFDLSPSDLKDLPEWPPWLTQKKSKPTLMLYSVVDDRSGVAYQQYHAVYGEDVEAALRFLYRAMSDKKIDGFPFQGIPKMIYTDNGPIARSRIFQRVLKYLGIELRTHLPKGKAGRRTTARAKGKVERPFRTIKNVHEVLYHYHTPKNEEEANEWLLNYVLRYNEKDHRSQNHSRIEDWIENIPPDGLQRPCSWERFTTFAREPERRKVAADATVKVGGSIFQVDPCLAGQEAVLWWGLFDSELFVEHHEDKYGPYRSDHSPISLNTFRSFRKSKSEKRADAIEKLAKDIALPIVALSDDSRSLEALKRTIPINTTINSFSDPDPFDQFEYESELQAKKAIADYLGTPLARLDEEDKKAVDSIVRNTLEKQTVIREVRQHFRQSRQGERHAK